MPIRCFLGGHEWTADDLSGCLCIQCRRREDHVWDEWRFDGARSCQRTRTCVRCGHSLHTVEHDWEDWKYESTGSCKSTRSCSRCGLVQHRVTHTYRPSPGSGTKRDTTCARCGHVQEEELRSCTLCHGTGFDGWVWECTACSGTGGGSPDGTFTFVPCPACNGEGYGKGRNLPCSSCGGTGNTWVPTGVATSDAS